MKKHLLRVCSVLVALTYFANTANSTILLKENFDNCNAGNLEGQSGWVLYSGSTEPIQLVQNSLSYVGYSEGSNGFNVRLESDQTSGIDLKKDLSEVFIPSAQNPVLYVSFLVKAESAGTASFVSLLGAKSKISTPEYLHIAVVPSSTGKVKFSIGRNNSVFATTTEEYDITKTHLLVAKYTYVEGTTNDIIDLFVDPIDLSKEPTTANAVYNGEDGSDISDTKGAVSVQLRQGQNFKFNAPKVNVDNIIVATTWGELFGESAEEAESPIITLSKSEIQVEQNLFEGESDYKMTFKVFCKNLTGNVSLTENSEYMLLSKNEVTKDDAMNENGVEIQVTIKPEKVGLYSDVIMVKSENAIDAQLTISWCVMSKVRDFGEVMSLVKTQGYFNGKVVNGLLVSHVYLANMDNWCFLQDEYSAFQLKYNIEDVVLKDGDLMENIIITYTNDDGLIIDDFGVITHEKEVIPSEITIKELKNNPDKYQYRLVKLADVNFVSEESIDYGKTYAMFQNNDTIELGVFDESEVIGTLLPKKADVVGISRNAKGTLVSPRFNSDIVAKSSQTNIELTNDDFDIWTDGKTLNILINESSNIDIYNTLGKSIGRFNDVNRLNLTLPEGIYIVKIKDNLHKILIK